MKWFRCKIVDGGGQIQYSADFCKAKTHDGSLYYIGLNINDNGYHVDMFFESIDSDNGFEECSEDIVPEKCLEIVNSPFFKIDVLKYVSEQGLTFEEWLI